MPVKFGVNERKVKDAFLEGAIFCMDGEVYTVINSGKPTCHKGEPKTDIYVSAVNDKGLCIELKISFKQDNADFLENKTNAERAEQLFGKEWSSIIAKSIKDIKDAFELKPLIYKEKKGRTEKGCITLGWKFELLNKHSGQLSGLIELTDAQKIDVYSGSNLPQSKKNARVNSEVVVNSGVANYILLEKDMKDDIQSLVDSLKPIDEYARTNGDIYFACKALNYRTKVKKYDGNRPLAVHVKWTVENGKLKNEIVYEQPLEKCGTEIANMLIESMKELGIKDTDDINIHNFLDFSKVNG